MLWEFSSISSSRGLAFVLGLFLRTFDLVVEFWPKSVSVRPNLDSLSFEMFLSSCCVPCLRWGVRQVIISACFVDYDYLRPDFLL